ncbi:MAG: dihydropteroate synthase [Spirochaetales bacterium]|nr:dihydropteroate synthase [Spirochaetales bacterium]
MGTRLRLPRDRFLDLGAAFHVMGIINLTPDSFWEGSRKQGVPAAVDTAAAMIDQGATILDLGGESTRPGSAYVSVDDELDRVVPAVAAIRARWDVALSVDTRKATVARAAVGAGADIVNDVAALGDDPDMAPFCAAAGVPVVLMHKKGIPATMQDRPYYDDCPQEVRTFLLDRAMAAMAAGIRPESIVLDPGVGFGKRLEDNLALLNRLDELAGSGYPVLVGLSRKSFIGALTGRPTEDRLAGSLAAACAALQKGARIFRVHDVAATMDALDTYSAIMKPPGAAAQS